MICSVLIIILVRFQVAVLRLDLCIVTLLSKGWVGKRKEDTQIRYYLKPNPGILLSIPAYFSRRNLIIRLFHGNVLSAGAEGRKGCHRSERLDEEENGVS